MKFHLWPLHHHLLSLASLLVCFIPNLLPHYVICGFNLEDHLHLFRDCPFAIATWTKFLPRLSIQNYDVFFMLEWKDWIKFNLSLNLSPYWPVKFAVIVFVLKLFTNVLSEILLMFSKCKILFTPLSNASFPGSHLVHPVANSMLMHIKMMIEPLLLVLLSFVVLSLNGFWGSLVKLSPHACCKLYFLHFRSFITSLAISAE